MPQFSALLVTSTQLLPHADLPVGQPHLPAEQACPVPHFVSQLPQALEVLCTSTQASPHLVRPLGQGCVAGMHVFTAQISPVLQALSQLPQCLAELRLEHSVPHSCSPTPHWHLPSTQPAPPMHAVSQLPQCAASDLGS